MGASDFDHPLKLRGRGSCRRENVQARKSIINALGILSNSVNTNTPNEGRDATGRESASRLQSDVVDPRLSQSVQFDAKEMNQIKLKSPVYKGNRSTQLLAVLSLCQSQRAERLPKHASHLLKRVRQYSSTPNT